MPRFKRSPARWIPIVAVAVVVAAAFAAIPKFLMRDPSLARDQGEPRARRPRRDEPRVVRESEVCPPGDASLEENPFVVRGKVRDERGQPVPGEVSVVGLESVGPRVSSRPNGSFTLALKIPDVVRIGVAAEGRVSHVSRRMVVTAGGQVDLGAVSLAPGEAIAGVVVDDAGGAVAGATLSIESDEPVEPEGWAETRAATARWDRVRSDRDGRFRIDGLPKGRYAVRVRPGARGDARSATFPGIAAGSEGLRLVVPARLVTRRHTVRARVFGPSGDLVPGVRAWVVHPHDAVHSARLGSKIEVEAFDPGPTWLVIRDAVDASGQALPWGPAAVRLEPTAVPLDVYLPEREGVRGRVVDEAGNGVETVLVAEGRLRADGTAVPTDSPARVGTDWVRVSIPFASGADGGFRVAALPPGRLRLRAEGFVPWRVVEPELVSPGPDPVVVRLQPVSHVAFRVEAPAGETVEQAHIRIARQRPGGDVAESRLTACGAAGGIDVRRAVDTEGPYAVEVRAIAGGRSLRPATLRDLRPGEAGRTIRLEPGLSIGGSVVLPDGSPAADALVRAFRADAPEEETPPRARADAGGAFVLGGLDPGRWRVVATTRGHVATTDVEVGASEAGAEGERPLRIELGTARSITARLEAPAEGLEGFRVAVFDEAGRPVGATVEGPAEDGSVHVRPLPPGRSRLHAWNASDPDDPRHALGDLVENGARDVPLRLVRGAVVAGRVVGSDGAPIEAATVVVSGEGLVRVAPTDEGGGFVVNGLPAGEYVVEARVRERTVRVRRSASEGGGEPLEVVLP